VLVAACVDEAHFFHQPIVRQVGPALGDVETVQRQIRKFVLAVPPRQFADLCGADAAVAVVDDDVGVGTLVGSWQGCGLVGHERCLGMQNAKFIM